MRLRFKQIHQNRDRRSIAAVVLAALAASVCCVGPLVLLALGVGGAWVGNLTTLEPFRPYLMGFTLLVLGYAFYSIYRKPKAKECAPGSYCAHPKSDRINKISLWVVTVLVAVLFSIPYGAEYLAKRDLTGGKSLASVTGAPREVQLSVPGMNCPSCPFTVQKSLTNLDGVISAKVTFKDKQASVTYDPAKVTVEQLIAATTKAGYPSKIINP